MLIIYDCITSKDLLFAIKNWSICKGMPQDDDDVHPFLVDPTLQFLLESGAVLRYSVLKLLFLLLVIVKKIFIHQMIYLHLLIIKTCII